MKLSEIFSNSYVQMFDDRKYWKTKPELPYYKKIVSMEEFEASVLKYEALNRKGVGIFFTPNPCSGGRKEENVTAIKWVFVDMDDGSKDDQMKRIMKSPIKPSLIIESKRSYHCYWRCDMDKDRFKELIQGVIYYFNGDMALTSANEVLRMPNFLHMKYENHPFKVKIIHNKVEELNYADMVRAYPPPLKKWKSQYSLVDDDLSVVKDIPIKKVLDSFGVQYSKKNELVEDGEVTSAIINENQNYINRFSGKPPSGSTIDVVMYFNNMEVGEAIKWLKEKFLHTSPLDKKKISLAQPVKNELGDFLDKDWDFNHYTWGTPNLDMEFGPLNRTMLTVVYGSRGQGKTTYIYDMMAKNAKLGHKVLFISLEMTLDELGIMFSLKYSGLSPSEIRGIREGKVPVEKRERYNRKRKEIFETANLTLSGVSELKGREWEKIMEFILSFENLDLIVIDNLDLIAGRLGEGNNEKQIRIIQDMHDFLKKYKVPIILLHHQRKYSAGANAKGVGMDDMSGSGKVADTADNVLKVSRNTDPMAEGAEKYKTTLIFEKVRFFTIKMADIYFNRGTFEDMYSRGNLCSRTTLC